jgi:hypothetical protein
MLPDPFEANVDIGGGSPTTRDFVIVSQSANQVLRRNITASSGTVERMRVSHSVVGKNQFARDRHLLRLETNGWDGTSVDPTHVGSIYIVADLPRVNFPDAYKAELFAQLIGIMRGGSGDAFQEWDATLFFDRWINGEG